MILCLAVLLPGILGKGLPRIQRNTSNTSLKTSRRNCVVSLIAVQLERVCVNSFTTPLIMTFSDQFHRVAVIAQLGER